jgi:alkylation response protein AidB-like acyl-CoA dehydrogenase
MDLVDKSPDNKRLRGRGGRFCRNTQIYEGTNQVQRIVAAKHLLK